MNPFSPIISERLHIPASQVDATLDLLAAGCTIPFISRYRKEATGNLDEVQIAAIITTSNYRLVGRNRD